MTLEVGKRYGIPDLGRGYEVSYVGESKVPPGHVDVAYHCPKMGLISSVSDTSSIPIDGSGMKSLSGNQLVPNNQSVEFRVGSISADKRKLELIVKVKDRVA